jgi:signal peptidase I
MEPKKKESFKDFLFITVTSLILVFAIRTYIAQPFVVSGESMDPTFHTGEYLIVDQITYNFNDPQRGDVIVFRYPVMPSKFFIKRIIGLPGETIKIQGEKVFIKENDTSDFIEIKEDYIEFGKDTFMETKLENDQYFVMGDNRLASLDSRIWGPT